MMTLQHPIKFSSSVRDWDGIPLALAKTEDGGVRVVVWKGMQWELSKGSTVSEVLRYPEASPEFLMEVGIIVNKVSGFYILNCSNDIFDCKTDKQKISWDKYYIFGFSNNFNKTEELIFQFLKDSGWIKTKSRDSFDFNCQYIPKIAFNRKELLEEFTEYITGELKIKIYDDQLYLSKKNTYSLQELRIGDFDDHIMGKIISSYTTNLFYNRPYDCNVIRNKAFRNDWKYDPYKEFEPEGKGSIGSAENVIHSRRELKECTYLYIVGPKNAEEGIHNFKIGKAKDLNARIIAYQSHSPHKVQLYFYQSCFGTLAERIEDSLLTRLKRGLGMIHQDWVRMTLINILLLVKNRMKEYKQPEYKIVKYNSYADIYIPIKHKKEIKHETASDHICIDERNCILSKIPGGRTGYEKERDKRKKIIKKFKKIDDLYNYFYENFNKINKPL